ncbi:hypothetical protein ANN_18955 [Periplaneta americana]|uniref:Reverse transcriptase domain-containing protein n=1 Tax=Periplaneta americana TaxID=6978 RepID=A0ABQ8SR94_PERAM|nr:hypothetical protein ANN_18955 [Periplaneta americana]
MAGLCEGGNEPPGSLKTFVSERCERDAINAHRGGNKTDLVLVQIYMPYSGLADEKVAKSYDKIEEIAEKEKKIEEIAEKEKGACVILMGDRNAIVGEEQDEGTQMGTKYIEELYKTGNRAENLAVEDEAAVSEGEKEFPVLSKEVELALREMMNGKATGIDGIPIELIKCLSENRKEFISYNEIFEKGEWPEDFTGTISLPVPNKNVKNCNAFRSIILIPHSAKIFLRILNRRLYSKLKGELEEEQFSFRKGKATTTVVTIHVQWPERSLDLSPLYFFLWRTVKDSVYQNSLTTPDDMQQRIQQACVSIQPATCRAVIQSFGERLRILDTGSANGTAATGAHAAPLQRLDDFAQSPLPTGPAPPLGAGPRYRPHHQPATRRPVPLLDIPWRAKAYQPTARFRFTSTFLSGDERRFIQYESNVCKIEMAAGVARLPLIRSCTRVWVRILLGLITWLGFSEISPNCKAIVDNLVASPRARLTKYHLYNHHFHRR